MWSPWRMRTGVQRVSWVCTGKSPQRQAEDSVFKSWEAAEGLEQECDRGRRGTWEDYSGSIVQAAARMERRECMRGRSPEMMRFLKPNKCVRQGYGEVEPEAIFKPMSTKQGSQEKGQIMGKQHEFTFRYKVFRLMGSVACNM